MAKVVFSEKWLRSQDRRPARAGKRLMDWDAGLPGLVLQTTDKGTATFKVMRRLRGRPTPIKRTIGAPWTVPWPKGVQLPFRLAAIRDEARAALTELSNGIDPKLRRAEEVRAAETAARRSSERRFGIVIERFISEHISKLRSGGDAAATIRREMVPRWKDLPVGEITRADVVKMIRAVAADRPYIARHLHAYASKFFRWAIATEEFDVRISPCDGIRATEVIGAKADRDRVLDDIELAHIWKTIGTLGLPWTPFLKLLVLTGQRRDEVANATWGEFDLKAGIWTIPAARMKGDAAHVVPLAPRAIALLQSIPREDQQGVDAFVFSTTSGRRPVSGFSKLKKRLDTAVAGWASDQHGDPNPKIPPPWRLHDLRRTMRTNLGGLPVPSNVAELCIAHIQPGMHKVYDRWAYLEEKRRAFTLWEARLMAIVDPPSSGNIVKLAAAG